MPRRAHSAALRSFLSTLSLRRATNLGPVTAYADAISIHALLAESDAARCQGAAGTQISIHALLAESDNRRAGIPSTRRISIHALLAESDCKWTRTAWRPWHFYPRSPCGERRGRIVHAFLGMFISIHALLAESDVSTSGSASGPNIFLSTLSLRRATAEFFCVVYVLYISIHALLAESDTRRPRASQSTFAFLSTLSLRRATQPAPKASSNGWISIHALLAESDRRYIAEIPHKLHFYPRSPCGERRYHPVFDRGLLHFYPRSPCGERHSRTPKYMASIRISIHALLAESDSSTVAHGKSILSFLSTLSLRRATSNCLTISPDSTISIHALLAESDDAKIHGINKCDISIHALLAESDLLRLNVKSITGSFLSTLSLRRATQIQPE